MAIDTKAKRMSMLSVCIPIPWAHLFEVDGSVDADDRATLLHLYGGIPLDAITVVDTPGVRSVNASFIQRCYSAGGGRNYTVQG